jgi:hypothetical protein
MATRPQSAAFDKRTEPRVLCSQLVGVEWTDREGGVRSCVANLEDISASGACLHSEEPIPVEESVKIAYGANHLSGVVRYCVHCSVGYLLGIQFEPETRWSDEKFRPRHMTDVGKLLKQAIRRARLPRH